MNATRIPTVPYRSNFLVHWTGKDLVEAPDLQSLSDPIRVRFRERLYNTVEQGLWMTIPEERLEGENRGDQFIEYKAPMTCFTENPVHRIRSHARRYGPMGFAFKRSWVLDLLGGPVQYVRHGAPECVVGNANVALNALKWALEQSSDPSEKAMYEHAHECFALNGCFLKKMSDVWGQDDFDLIEESEWRIVHTHLMERRGRIVATGVERPKYKIPFDADELEILIVPDSQMADWVWADPTVSVWIRGARRPPKILTLEECEHF